MLLVIRKTMMSRISLPFVLLIACLVTTSICVIEEGETDGISSYQIAELLANPQNYGKRGLDLGIGHRWDIVNKARKFKQNQRNIHGKVKRSEYFHAPVIANLEVYHFWSVCFSTESLTLQ
ncbi:uncharacterized protein LOC125648297 isoform X1 [Ostrea edulis]|uniref:uncharacterized protein LOC125648297 isoform X1 n=1 Tax=Ostrea edulis TaxID=37623 RepID=UPI0024AFF10F|nr:uncharacterized protein LOC125648297 isoform X1 [Ostrea edulis]